jgi:PAP2 superfamily
MAWEQLTLSKTGSIVPRVGASMSWIALVIAGAYFTNFDEPYLPFVIAGAFAFFLRSKPSRWEIYGWLFTSALFVKVIHLSSIPFWVLRVAAGFSLLGFGAILLLGLRTVWSNRESQKNSLAFLAPALILIVFILTSSSVLRFSGSLSLQTEDAWLYAFDGSLGFQPSFAVGRVMFTHLVLARSAFLTYLSLPFAMAIVCAWKTAPNAKRISWHMLIVILLAGVGGWLLYNIIPGTGPIYAFGSNFPWHEIAYRDLARFAPIKISLPAGIPRNAMPSLHMGWAVLLYWNSKGFPRSLRAALFIFLILTVVATLGGGQHYLVDLVVSLPFVLAVQSASLLAAPNSRKQLSALFCGLGATFAWLVIIRFGWALVMASRIIPWTLVLITLVGTIWIRNWASNADENLAIERPQAAPSGLAAASGRN